MEQGMLDYISGVKKLDKNLHDLVVNQKTRLEWTNETFVSATYM